MRQREETETDRFARLKLLIGAEGIARLARARVAVVGLGGVGSYAAEALIRAGVGELLFVDGDVVCYSNTNRQLHALAGNYGRPKAEVMAERAHAINPVVKVIPRVVFVDEENLGEVLTPEPCYLIDAIDRVPAKVALLRYCLTKGIPVVSVMGAGNKFDPLAFRVDDLGRTHTCPLAKAVRKALREYGIQKGIKVVYSTEPPSAPEEPEPCAPAVPGSISYVPSVAGLIAAGVVIRDLLARSERI
ncbi:MAG: tRNA threonylcarbamoyladenosine dehydratase [Bacillota bacterium]